MKSKPIAILLTLLSSLLMFPSGAKAGEWFKGSVTTNAGSRNYSLWVPSSYDSRQATPVVMMLHGCMQKPEDLATISGMNAVADTNNFLVVYPEQTAEANPLRCWNWFDTKHQSHGEGEPALLAAIVQNASSNYNVDSGRVYVAGISAGAAMAVIMGATYPDVFSAIGVMAGLAFKSATTVETGLAAMKQGGPDPKQLGLLAVKAMGANARGNSKRRMPIIVFHGQADPYLNPLNEDQVIVQWARTNDYLDDGKDNDSVKAVPARTIEGSVPAGHSYTRQIFNDRSGRLLMEKWLVKGLGHAWSGAPAAGPFADPKGPNASGEVWRFFIETSRHQAKLAKPRGKD